MTDESNRDPSDPVAFRRVLAAVPTSVAVIAASADDGPVGVAVGSFTSVSLDPPLVGFLIAHTSTSWPLIQVTGRFAASVLAAEQEPVARIFATRGADKFGGCEWSLSPLGSPVIDGAAAWFDCRIDSLTKLGDHTFVAGQAEAMESMVDAQPLLFLAGSYTTARTPVTAPGSDAAWGASNESRPG